MQTADILANPFALMLNPAEVISAVDRSERLGRLQRRICRPLDKPVIAHKEDELLLSSEELSADADIGPVIGDAEATE